MFDVSNCDLLIHRDEMSLSKCGPPILKILRKPRIRPKNGFYYLGVIPK